MIFQPKIHSNTLPTSISHRDISVLCVHFDAFILTTIPIQEDQGFLRRRMRKLSVHTLDPIPYALSAKTMIFAYGQTDNSNILLHDNVPFHLVKYHTLRLIAANIPTDMLDQEITISADHRLPLDGH